MQRSAGRARWSLAAAGLAALALANAALARRAERQNPPTGRFVTVDGVRLHYLEQGSGPTVLLLHGNGSMAVDFAIAGLIDDLARDHRVIAIDRPGCGFSERPRGLRWDAWAQARLIHAALRELDVHQPIVVGHSWGTLVALAMAEQAPSDICRLVLISGYYNPVPRMDVVLFSAVALPVLGSLLRHTVLPLAGWLAHGPMFRALFAPAPVTTAFWRRFPTGLALRPSQLRATAEDNATMNVEPAWLRERYAEFALPVTIIAGRGDRIVDFDRQSARLANELPKAEFRLVPGAGHMVHHVAPELVTEAIRQPLPAAG